MRGKLLSPNPQYLWRGEFQSEFGEFPPLYDYWEREKIEVYSPAYDVATYQATWPDRWSSLMHSLPEGLVPLLGRGGHWVYFQLP
jgi:hypothetical protein